MVALNHNCRLAVTVVAADVTNQQRLAVVLTSMGVVALVFGMQGISQLHSRMRMPHSKLLLSMPKH